jgi:hypothetical protein
MRVSIMFLPLALLGCASQAADPMPYHSPPPPPPVVWERIDGRPSAEGQWDTTLATCRAVAMNAGNMVQIPSEVHRVTRIGDIEFKEADWAPTIALMHRNTTQTVNFRACMGQHGYRIAPPPQK